MYCPQCQKQIPDGAAFCPVCGRRFSRPVHAAPSSAGGSAPAAAPSSASVPPPRPVADGTAKPPFTFGQMFGLLCLTFLFFPAGWLLAGLNYRHPARKNQAVQLFFAGLAAMLFSLFAL